MPVPCGSGPEQEGPTELLALPAAAGGRVEHGAGRGEAEAAERGRGEVLVVREGEPVLQVRGQGDADGVFRRFLWTTQWYQTEWCSKARLVVSAVFSNHAQHECTITQT